MIWLLILFFIFPGSPSTGVANSGHRGPQQLSFDSQQTSDIYNLISHYMIWVLILFFLFLGRSGDQVSRDFQHAYTVADGSNSSHTPLSIDRRRRSRSVRT